MKKLFAVSLSLMLAGCATHANIDMPVVSQVYDSFYENKSISYNIKYSQPEPGLFTAGEQMPLVDIKDAKLSVASAATLKKLPEYITQQLPPSVKISENNSSDFEIIVELVAKDKKGPAYADYNAGESFVKNFLTIGFAASEYQIVADFSANYKLYYQGKEIYAEKYVINESVDHERGDFDSFNSLNDYAGQLLERHLILTLNDFFKDSAEAIKS